MEEDDSNLVDNMYQKLKSGDADAVVERMRGAACRRLRTSRRALVPQAGDQLTLPNDACSAPAAGCRRPTRRPTPRWPHFSGGRRGWGYRQRAGGGAGGAQEVVPPHLFLSQSYSHG